MTTTQGKHAVFVRLPQELAEAIRKQIEIENERRAKKERPPLFVRGERVSYGPWVRRAALREIARIERGPRGRVVTSTEPERQPSPVSISVNIEIDEGTATRAERAVHVVNRRRAALGKDPVCVPRRTMPSLPAFFLRCAEREIRRLEREQARAKDPTAIDRGASLSEEAPAPRGGT